MCSPVHCALEKDVTNNFGSGEGRPSHEAHALFMYEPEHLTITALGVVWTAIKTHALGVDPPLWSGAAIKPFLPEICSNISFRLRSSSSQ
jgi:hypothetical protein